MYEQGAGVPVPRGSPSMNTLLPWQGCCCMVRAAVGHVKPQGIQYQVKKRMEAKIKMQAFIRVVQPAFLPSSGKECCQEHLPVWWSLTFLLPVCVKSAHFSVKLLLSQRSNSRCSFASRFSPQLSLHPHCIEASTFIPENLWYRSIFSPWDFWQQCDVEQEQCSWRLPCSLCSPVTPQPVF